MVKEKFWEKNSRPANILQTNPTAAKVLPNPEFPINSLWTRRAYPSPICILIGFAYRDVEARVRHVVSQTWLQRRARAACRRRQQLESLTDFIGTGGGRRPCLCTTCQCTDYRPCVSGSSLWNDWSESPQATHTDDRHGRCHPADAAVPLLVILVPFCSLICSHTDSV